MAHRLRIIKMNVFYANVFCAAIYVIGQVFRTLPCTGSQKSDIKISISKTFCSATRGKYTIRIGVIDLTLERSFHSDLELFYFTFYADVCVHSPTGNHFKISSAAFRCHDSFS